MMIQCLTQTRVKHLLLRCIGFEPGTIFIQVCTRMGPVHSWGRTLYFTHARIPASPENLAEPGGGGGGKLVHFSPFFFARAPEIVYSSIPVLG